MLIKVRAYIIIKGKPAKLAILIDYLLSKLCYNLKGLGIGVTNRVAGLAKRHGPLA